MSNSSQILTKQPFAQSGYFDAFKQKRIVQAVNPSKTLLGSSHDSHPFQDSPSPPTLDDSGSRTQLVAHHFVSTSWHTFSPSITAFSERYSSMRANFQLNLHLRPLSATQGRCLKVLFIKRGITPLRKTLYNRTKPHSKFFASERGASHCNIFCLKSV